MKWLKELWEGLKETFVIILFLFSLPFSYAGWSLLLFPDIPGWIKLLVVPTYLFIFFFFMRIDKKHYEKHPEEKDRPESGYTYEGSDDRPGSGYTYEGADFGTHWDF